MKQQDGSHLVLSTGRTFYANNLILGLSAGANDPALYHGYDGSVEVEPGEVFARHEREEIAAFMIERWKRWAE